MDCSFCETQSKHNFDCVLHSSHCRASVELCCPRCILVTSTCKVICAINRRLKSAAFRLLHNLTHFMRSHLSTMSIAFANKSIAFCFQTSNIGIQVQPEGGRESPKVSLLLSCAPPSPAGLLSDERAKGRAERSWREPIRVCLFSSAVY